MDNFTFARAKNADQAKVEVRKPQAQFIGGGTNLIDLIKENVERPLHLVDINSLDLKKIEVSAAGTLKLGALTTNSQVAYDEKVLTLFPLLAKAILAGASPQLRNMATTGGNPLQRTRCYYFYDLATPCNKRNPGTGCSALHGLNRIHAILGTSEKCIAVHPSDMSVGLLAMDAKINLTGESGERQLEFKDLHRLPGDTPERDNNLERGELITSIEIPGNNFSKTHTYLKLRDRSSYAFALVSVAVGLEIEKGVVKSVGVALGGIAHKPWRDVEAEKILIGNQLRDDIIKNFAAKLLKDAKGFGKNDFKIELSRRAIHRAINEASLGAIL